jgi:GR25 family glycosyltransferase involved in LPS biosynthesis
MTKTFSLDSTKLCIISISGESRMASSTRELAREYKSRGNLIVHGIDGNKNDFTSIFTENDKTILEFITGGTLSNGELGCLLSHQEMYKYVIDSECNSAIIIEDDAKLIIHPKYLESVIELCQKSNFDLVSFYSSGGGIVRLINNGPFAKSLVPGLGAVAYWINSNAAKMLLAKNCYLGLADWPLSIATIRSAQYVSDVFTHSDLGRSIISKSQQPYASKRTSIIYQKFTYLLHPQNIAKIFVIIKEIGFVPVVRILIAYRVYKRFFRLLLKVRRGSNQTIVIQSIKNLIKKN